jgi:glycosyltransferase involved in cell wall biosynthesis
MSGGAQGTVSIVIPTYFRNDLLREAVESALAQEYQPVEVIVVDDSAEEHARPVAEEYADEVTYVPLEENVGENPARDAALDVASGEYVQFLDDDDLLRPDKLAKQVPLLDEECGVCYSGLTYHESGEQVLPDPEVRGDVLEEALKFELWPPCFTSTLLVERALIEEVRPLRHHGAGDTTILIGLAQRTEFTFVDEPLVRKRIEVDSLGFSLENVANKRTLLEEFADVYARYPECRAAARTHVYSQEGHVRLFGGDRIWSPRASLAFAKATYHAPSDRDRHLATCLGSLAGRPGITASHRGRDFVVLWRERGLRYALARTGQVLTQALRSRS